MPNKKIVTRVMVHPTEYVTAQARYYNDSDIGRRLSGKNTIDIADSQHSSFFSSNKEITSTGAILNTGGVTIIYIMIKNKTGNDAFLALDGSNYKTKISKNDVFSTEVNSISSANIKMKTSSGTETTNIEYIVAQ
jgi:hypothetical protein|tara:strand:+ start:4012 stop:4416 length:405 start_codon:yes stop_codon:yes gene_type:complete